MSTVIDKLADIMADTYTLYLKTQNYHWHVTGPQFKALHELFEMQYQELAEAVDLIAERIRSLGSKTPASFAEFIKLKKINEGTSTLNAQQMVTELAADNDTLVNDLNAALKLAQEHHDEGTATILGDRIAAHQKARWMLKSSL